MTETDKISIVKRDVKRVIDRAIAVMRTKCPRVMMYEFVGESFALNQPNVSLNYDDIRDIITEKPLAFKCLLEECLKAKQIMVSMWEEISLVFDDFNVKGEDTSSIFYEAFGAENFKSVFHFPFYLKQKLLVTACTHHARDVFGPPADKSLSIPPADDSFVIDGNVYPTIFDQSYVEKEFQGITANTIGGNVFESAISEDTRFYPELIQKDSQLMIIILSTMLISVFVWLLHTFYRIIYSLTLEKCM